MIDNTQLLHELETFDRCYLDSDSKTWRVIDFHHWDTLHFEPLLATQKIELLLAFRPQSNAVQLWYWMQWNLVDPEKVDKAEFYRLFTILPLSQKYMVYTQLIRASFVGRSQGFDTYPLFLLICKEFATVSNTFGQVSPLVAGANEGIVLILTNQFVGSAHGPTLTTLNYASALKKMGKHPIVICTTCVPKVGLYNNPLPAPVFFGNVRDEYFKNNTLFNIDHRTETELPGRVMVECWGEQFDFVQLAPMDAHEHLQELIQLVNSLNARYILGVGAMNPVLELIAAARPVLNIPCVTSLDTTPHSVPVLHRELTKSDELRLQHIDYKKPVLISRLPFRLRENKGLRTSSIEDRALNFVVVGHRLEQEIKADFIQTLVTLKTNFPQAAFVFIGPDNLPALPAMIQQCSYFTGLVSNAIELIGSCHFMLNPKRQGGGTSAIEAMSLGIPVLTEPFGDVYQYIGDAFVCCNDEERVEFIRTYLNESECRNFYDEHCRAVYDAATDTASLLQHLLLDFDQYIYQHFAV
ncbi:hypothetical protein WH43_10130 [Rheinheimera sp. KL1]|uniref:glycosyltransferase n=1 Tax=Rheinheimera sp. KL1 TaxID=1635005 RepID=UPI0006C11C04|nr:glycosyltransferase [Rheinheimera sp. KL1]KOO58137.1 hypothetical protein WH43_10130 [Rheinheimera sp. KL1]